MQMIGNTAQASEPLVVDGALNLSNNKTAGKNDCNANVVEQPPEPLQTSESDITTMLQYFDSLEKFFQEKAHTKDIIPADHKNYEKFQKILADRSHSDYPNLSTKLNELKSKHYLHFFLPSRNTNETDHSLPALAKAMMRHAANKTCNPYHALAFVELCNRSIKRTFLSNILHTKHRFIQLEQGNVYKSILISLVGLAFYLLTIFNVIPHLLGLSFMATLGVIGLISAERIILQPSRFTQINKTNPCIFLNIILLIIALILTFLAKAPIIMTLGLLGTLAPLVALFYDHKITLDAIASRTIANQDATNVDNLIKKYNLSGIFHINKQVEVEIGDNIEQSALTKN